MNEVGVNGNASGGAETECAMGMTQLPILYLIYHRVSREGPVSYPYTVTPERFKEHLEVTAGLEKNYDGSFLPSRLTFDDGHESNYEQAMPLLAAFGRSAYFFVTTGWIENRTGFMRWSHVSELQKCGHRIGAHGWSHRHLTQCSDVELQDEVWRSRNTLEQRMGCAVESISVPGGRWDGRVLRACAAAGYRQIFTSDPGTVIHLREGVQIVPRFIATESLYPVQLRRLLAVDSRVVCRARAAHQAKKVLRWALGDRVYHDLWCACAGWRNDEEGTVR
jgi:peptidoglycan/xylan/chitin deacetylase (PgdA/CDA1 family)